MNTHGFSFHGVTLQALPSGALHWPEAGILVVSDLHLGKSARLSAVGGAQLPPYETRETLQRLDDDLAATKTQRVICLGDSFDAPGIESALPQEDLLWITRLQAGREWIWIAGNHDPAPVTLKGAHRAEHSEAALTFRHIATPDGRAEVSGHYHPKARLSLRGRSVTRPCFLVDDTRLILPAYGAYTGGLHCDAPVLSDLMDPSAQAILTGPRPVAIPMPRRARAG
ncbi:ligase-associated DNA damage response endonuclease PdeM [Mameliella sp. AT18]|uniref:ligase-associated DNA damage response endonuclease PdeM n=1 Tax=Mameliella sp. AT18 TaxID=3028385 RepID=UPI0008411699|nr:ligase-associated DNA damage response endonuclease PdeM [Mameliella sp. AT18]MDD9731351.1 ligase-associated DNA damage response endonuclease PdeM [Mameliella sp. AT18]ODM50378.1 metallophosphoesterase [Ruegeria sp. PBVC088]